MHTMAFGVGKCEWKSTKSVIVHIAVVLGYHRKTTIKRLQKPVADAKVFHYNYRMMYPRYSKGLILSILLLCVCISFAWAGVSFDSRPGITASFGGAFTIPTEDYLSQYPGDPSVKMPPVRTSYGYNVDLNIVDIGLGSNADSRRIHVGLGVSFVGVSRSIAFGSSVLKAYHGVGAFLAWNASFDSFDLSTAAKLFICEFRETKASFIAGELEIAPNIPLVTSKSVRLSLAIPMALFIKADSLVLRLSCGLRLDYSITGFKEAGR